MALGLFLILIVVLPFCIYLYITNKKLKQTIEQLFIFIIPWPRPDVKPHVILDSAQKLPYNFATTEQQTQMRGNARRPGDNRPVMGSGCEVRTVPATVKQTKRHEHGTTVPSHCAQPGERHRTHGKALRRMKPSRETCLCPGWMRIPGDGDAAYDVIPSAVLLQ